MLIAPDQRPALLLDLLLILLIIDGSMLASLKFDQGFGVFEVTIDALDGRVDAIFLGFVSLMLERKEGEEDLLCGCVPREHVLC